MTSLNKKKKGKNSYCSDGALKIKGKSRLKRLFFYTSAKRKQLKKLENDIFE